MWRVTIFSPSTSWASASNSSRVTSAGIANFPQSPGTLSWVVGKCTCSDCERQTNFAVAPVLDVALGFEPPITDEHRHAHVDGLGAYAKTLIVACPERIFDDLCHLLPAPAG